VEADHAKLNNNKMILDKKIIDTAIDRGMASFWDDINKYLFEELENDLNPDKLDKLKDAYLDAIVKELEEK